MRPNPDVVRIAAQALAMAPSRETILEPWGLTYNDCRAANLGLFEQALLIPFHDMSGYLVGVKRRHLGASPDGRFSWLSKGRAPALYFPTHHTTLGDEIILCEGPLKSLALGVILGRPVCALPSGVQTGIPPEGRHLFIGKRVLYIGDPDPEGRRCPARLTKQLARIARGLRCISFPDPTWRADGAGQYDVNDVLRHLRKRYGDKADQVFPGVAAHILSRLEQSPDLLAVEVANVVPEGVSDDDSEDEALEVLPIAACPDTAYRGLLGDIALAYAEQTEAPPAYFLFDALTYLGAIVAPWVRVELEIHEEPRLFAGKIGRSAWARKSSAQERIHGLYEVLGREWLRVCHGAGSGEGLAALFSKHPGMGLILSLDEFRYFVDKATAKGSVLMSMVGSLFHKIEYENSTKGHHIAIQDARLSLIFSCTHRTWEKMFTDTFRDIGFFSRLFLVYGESTGPVSAPARLDAVRFGRFRDGLNELVDHARTRTARCA